MVASYRPNREIDLVRNPDWSRSTDFRPAYLDRIVMPEGNDVSMLHSTDVHAVANENLGVWDLAFTSLR